MKKSCIGLLIAALGAIPATGLAQVKLGAKAEAGATIDADAEGADAKAEGDAAERRLAGGVVGDRDRLVRESGVVLHLEPDQRGIRDLGHHRGDAGPRGGADDGADDRRDDELGDELDTCGPVR